MKLKKKTVIKKWRSVAHLAVVMLRKRPSITLEEVTKEVRKNFPKSRWQRTHFVWYRSAIRSGRIAKGKTTVTKC